MWYIDQDQHIVDMVLDKLSLILDRSAIRQVTFRVANYWQYVFVRHSWTPTKIVDSFYVLDRNRNKITEADKELIQLELKLAIEKILWEVTLQFFNKTAPIGIFDSGIGGLTVAKRIISMLPNENIVYFGDTARVPYGSKSNSTVIEYAIQDAQFLINKNVKLIIVACNTASSVALDVLKEKFSIPIIGMIEPGATLALDKTKNGKVGVIGTNSTINNKAYSQQLKELDKEIKVFEKACPLFVPIAEEGWLDHEATNLIAKEYLQDFVDANIDTLILGCTHYPLLAETIQKIVGDSVTLIDSGYAASLQVENYLEGRGVRNDSVQIGTKQFYVSDLPDKFKSMAERFLGSEVMHIEKIDVESLPIH